MLSDDMRRLILLTITAATLLGYGQADEKYASFYGASYIHLPVQEAKGATDISFRFRTSSPDAMLLLAAGKTDYCLIKLEAGRLKVHINLGAGESELMSQRGLILNDLNWHEVNLTRREANLTLQIDVIHIKRLLLPGRFFELNIHYGVFIGGRGDFNELFLGHTDYLRGCMADILYNGANVIEYAMSRKSQSEVTAITWGCSSEFNATRNEDISFVEDGAFAIIPRLIPRSGSSWTFELRTATDRGLLLYNAGQSSYADFLGIELFEGKIRLLMNKGIGPTELIHDRIVADGKWHRVIVKFTPNDIGISVDEQDKSMLLPSGGNHYLDLSDTLYIGGTELNKRARAIGKGLRSGDVSFKGCLRNMMLENKEIGLPDVKVSQGIVSRCVWKFPCIEDDPCIAGASCHQLGVSSFKCTCNQSLCIKPNYAENYTIYSSANLPVNLEILSLIPLAVFEGESALVTSKNIAIVLDIAKYGVVESGVVFTLVSPPLYGTLALDFLNTRSEHSFTLQDVNTDKIRYMHDGSETTEDSMILELTLAAGAGYTLPGYLQGRLGFPLHVNVTPVNDPPLLEIPTAKVLRLAQGTKKTLTKELIWAIDADTPSDMLVYTVLRTDTDAGHVERVTDPSQPIDTFTQAELMQGLIAYVQHGNGKPNAMLGLKVSDGIESSEPAHLRISAYPLQIKLSRNTGLIVVHQSFSYLTPANLSFATNSEETGIDIRYEIVAPPKYGILEKLKDPSDPHSWTSVEHFTSRDLQQQCIRYIHKHGTPNKDEFRFYARVREVKTQQVFDFRINFIDLELKEMKRASINFTEKSEVTIGSQSLKYQTNPLVSSVSKIVYTLKSNTKYGNVLLKNQQLFAGDNFTQEDIDSGRLRYRLYRKSYSIVHEVLRFRVSAPQCTDVESALKLEYHPSRKNDKFSINEELTLETLKVDEGYRVALRVTRINPIKDYGVSSLMHNLTKLPQHGWLIIPADTLPDNSSKLRGNELKSLNTDSRVNATYFTTEELYSRRVYYVHDDSETKEDSFEFVATSLTSDFMYIGKFRIEIVMRNDNPPKRKIRKVFQIVLNGERLIRNNDLAYVDEDIDTKPDELIYTVKDKRNIAVYRLSDPTIQIREFSQKDIDVGQILLRHYDGNRKTNHHNHSRVDESARLEFSITDGHFFTDDVLEIEASSPYIILKNNTNVSATIVRTNESVVIRAEELDVETNVYVIDETEIEYQITEKPKHGRIMKQDRETSMFYRKDLLVGQIFYKNHDSGNSTAKKDSFKFRVSIASPRNAASKTTTEGHFIVRIYPEIYWEPLTVKNNRTIFVEEATSVLLSRKHLEIIHPKISPTEIIYVIKEWPDHGYLELQTHDDHLEETKDPSQNSQDIGSYHTVEYYKVKRFEQNLIDEGRLFYVQSATNQSHDKFVVDVTNGVTWLRGLRINFVIVPEKIYIETKDLRVVEGNASVLTESHFMVVSPYYAGKIKNYEIVSEPKHGIIYDSFKNSPVYKFTQKNLASGFISYKHDGNESSKDSFKVIATIGEKTSEPFLVSVTVDPVNDEVPVLLTINRTKLVIWQGGSIVLNSSYVAAVDEDTPASEITFGITRVRNGYLSLVAKPLIEIYNFTQEQIDRSHVLFTHTNGSDADFSFVLHDGVHTTNVHTIPVMTKPVRLTVIRNEPLNVFPLMKNFISSKSLFTTCSDEARIVRYAVKIPPQLGKIIVETSEDVWLESNRFTQKDVDNNKVMYEHTRQFMDLKTNDSFVFDVETHFSRTLTNQIFQIDISVSSGGLDRYVHAEEVRVMEGSSADVMMNISGIVGFLRSRAGIENPEVQLKLVRQPSHGHVMLRPALNITTFTLSEVEGGKIAYFHDDSDTLEDRIEFSIYLTPGHILLVNTSIRVIIQPVNDMGFKLVTDAPYINVVQNQNQTISRDNLLTLDPDTPSDEIVYVVITGPNYGRLLLLPYEQSRNPNATRPSVTTLSTARSRIDDRDFHADHEVRQVIKFTQYDIDSNRLVYEHNGPLQADSFYFRVWDGQFNPAYTVFNVRVLPIRLNVTVLGAINLQQGSNVAHVTADKLKLDTNARQELVNYRVTGAPKYGVLFVREVAVESFKQTDLLSKVVMYMQTDMTVSNDTFVLSAQVRGFEQTNIRVEIKVSPLMITSSEKMIALAGEKNRINLRYMDATPLAKLTSSNPVYTVIKKPKYSKIKRIIKSSSSSAMGGGIREKEVARFTHQEIVSGVIYLVCKTMSTMEYEGKPDAFTFIVVASIFQPAVGQFEYTLKLNLEDDNMTLGGPMDPVGHEGEMTIAPNMSNDYLLVLGMLMGVFLLGVVVIITIRCRHNRYKHADMEDDEDKIDVTTVAAVSAASNLGSAGCGMGGGGGGGGGGSIGVIPLPRPPDHLMPATPHLKPRFVNDDSSGVAISTPLPSIIPPMTTSTLPQCKVIPLTTLDSIANPGPEDLMDIPSRYPYGMPDGDDWNSSFDTSDLPSIGQSTTGTGTTAVPQRTTNPLLRRNQYWV